MGRYIVKRILQAIPLLLLISFIVFSLIHLAPYDVIDSLTTPNMSREQVEIIREQNGLNQSFMVQYMVWLKNILQGDFGYSLISKASISDELAVRIPNTIKLILPAYGTALAIATILGLLAGSKKGTWVDSLIDGIASIGIATPTFWFALILIYIFGYRLNWFPIIGIHSIGKENSLVDFFQHFCLPYLTLTVAFFPGLTRYIRSATIGQVDQDYVMVQESLKATKREIFTRHIAKNIRIPIVTQIGLALPMLVTGALITETIYAWPGVGPYLMQATKSMDYPVIMAVLLLSSTLVILGNLLSDVLYSLVDPRIGRS